MDFSTLTGEALTAALDLNITKASDAMLASALVPREEALTVLLAVETPTADQADTAEAITASVAAIEAEVNVRAEKVAAAATKFAAAKAAQEARIKAAADALKDDEKDNTYDADDTVEASLEDGDDVEDGDGDDADDAEGDDAGDDADDAEGDGEGDDGEGDGETVTAAGKRTGTTTKPRATKATAKAVARGNRRPAVKAANAVTITAAANVSGFSLDQKMDGVRDVAKAAGAVARAFPKFNEKNAKATYSQTGGQPQIHKHEVAKFAVDFDEALSAITDSPDADYSVVQLAVKQHKERLATALSGDGNTDEALTAAGWCAPSPIVYSWIADYVVDGMVTVPEVSAPRGGLQTTLGPRTAGGESQGATNLNNFGWIQTEAQAIAQDVKPFETIVCPSFVDHRLDAIGYAYKIPILTQKAYPELVTDTLRFADVLWAHKINKRLIDDLSTLGGTAKTFPGYGPSLTDTLEALSILAVKERRRWNLGVNAVLEVKLPQWVQEVFRADMSRRNNAPLDDPINEQRINAHFAARRLSVEYVSDWQELTGTAIVLPGTFDALIYPAGAVVKAVEDVVSLSAIYDAASLSINEYTGVFFEQGIMTFLAGYSVSKVTCPVNTAGEAGALSLTGVGDAIANGSF